MKQFVVSTVTLLMVPFGVAGGADPAPPEPAMVKAAQAFVATLEPEERKAVSLPFGSDERLNWHYFPKDRKGVSLKQMDSVERKAALALLRTGLSEIGYRKATLIRELEGVLHRLEKGQNRFARDPDLYYFTIFGSPSTEGTWGWRYEGHHITLNVTMDKGKIVAASPQFLGANPAEVRDGPMKGTRALAAEEDQARELLASLDAGQERKARFSAESPPEILTGADRRAKKQADRGIGFEDLTAHQQRKLIALIETHAGAQPPAIAKTRMAAIRKAGLDNVRFAWAGGTKPGEGHYYRVQGPTFLIEYANTQNSANHIHTVWRDFDGDFGLDVLALHYRMVPHDAAERGLGTLGSPKWRATRTCRSAWDCSWDRRHEARRDSDETLSWAGPLVEVAAEREVGTELRRASRPLPGRRVSDWHMEVGVCIPRPR